MGLLVHLVVAIYIHRHIGSEIIRNAVGIPVGIQGPKRTGIIINPDGQRDRPARAVSSVARNTEPVADPVVGDHRGIVWLVIVRRISMPLVDARALIGVI